MKDQFPKSRKSDRVKLLLNETVEVLSSLGIPIAGLTQRRLEKMAMSFLAVAGVTETWSQAQGLEDGRDLTSREIINFINQHFEENIADGSYDDIRRKDLKLPVLANLVINSGHNLEASKNDSTRGYSLPSDVKALVRTFRTKNWSEELQTFLAEKELLAETLARRRAITKVPVTLPEGTVLELSSGAHNVLQKKIIEEFLPRFGPNCEVLYIGDTARKILHINASLLEELHFFDLLHNKLPDILAYNQEQNWLYLIEAVHSTGPLNEIRLLELKRMTKDCQAKLIFVTAFLTKGDFRKWILDIAWETEVWIAESPDHLIHFDGEKYLSPY